MGDKRVNAYVTGQSRRFDNLSPEDAAALDAFWSERIKGTARDPVEASHPVASRPERGEAPDPLPREPIIGKPEAPKPESIR